MRHGRHHGDPARFEAMARFVHDRYGRDVTYIADVAGGQGTLTRLLRKKYNYDAQVVDPRGWTLKGVPDRREEFAPEMAEFYDLVIGLHPDEATRAVASAALLVPVILVPCCNFWDRSCKLGRDVLLDEIAAYFDEHGVVAERVTFGFKGPMNLGLVPEPPRA